MSNHSLSNPTEWIERYGDYLYRYALLQLQDTQNAEDLVQETLLAALKARKTFAGQSTEKTWLTGILRHKLIDFIRKKYREQAHLQFPESTDETAVNYFFDSQDHWDPKPISWANPRAALEEKEFWTVLSQCLETMPERAAQALTAKMIDNTPYEDLCKILNITTTHLGVLLHRARLQMRQCLEQKWFGKDAG